MLKLDHSELISNTNVGDQVQSLHEQYLEEIQNLYSMIASNQGEMKNAFEILEREKATLVGKIGQLEQQVAADESCRVQAK